MKNCNEMVNSLFERRERYIAEQKRKRKVIVYTATSVCCVCLVAMVGFGMRKGGIFGTAPSDRTAADTVYPGIKDNFDESKGESPDNPAANNKIVINSIDGIPKDRKMDICLLANDFVKMTRDEMVAYYGVDYIPDVPSDIKAWEDERVGIFKKDGGTGEVYWDADILNYSNEDFTRNVHLEVKKGSPVVQDCFYFNGTEEKSVINNVEVLIGKTDNGYYYAEFMYNGVGFLLNADGVTEDEFVSIVLSIVAA